MGAHVEQHKGIQRQCVCDVVDDCDPEVSAQSQQAQAKHSRLPFQHTTALADCQPSGKESRSCFIREAGMAALPVVGAPRAFSILVLGIEHYGDDGQDWLEEDKLKGAPLAHAHKRPIDGQGRHAARAVEEGGIHDVSVHLHLCRAQHAVNDTPLHLTEIKDITTALRQAHLQASLKLRSSCTL